MKTAFILIDYFYLNFHANRDYLKNLKRQTPRIECSYPSINPLQP